MRANQPIEAAIEEQAGELPEAQDFREWLGDAIRKTGAPPAVLSRRAGLSQNAVARFLKSDGDIYLGSAVALEREIHAIAAAHDVEIPRLAGGGVAR